MRKLVAILLALTLSLALLSACGAKPASSTAASAGSSAAQPAAPKETVTLRFWMGIPPEAGPQAVVDAFNQEYKDKGIQVEYERYVNDDQGNLKLETSLLAGGDIDVYVTYGNYRTVKRAEAGMAMDLTPFMERDSFDYGAMFTEEAKACYVNGVPYSMYTTVGKGSLLVNKDMFDAAGIPLPTEWTFEEFREVCKKLTKGEGQDKVYGMFWNSAQNMGEYMSYLAQQTLGGNWAYNEDGKTTRLNDPVTVASMQLVYDTMKDGTAPSHVDSVTQKLTQESMFLTGRCAMIVGNWAIRSVKDTAQYPHDFKTAYVPYPVVSLDQKNFVYGGFGDELTMNAKTEHPDETWEFMKWYATNGVKYMSAGGRIGLCNKLDPDEMISIFGKGFENLIDLDSAKSVFLVQPGDKLTVPTITTKGPEIYKALNEELEAAMNDKQTVQQAMDKANERANAFLAAG